MFAAPFDRAVVAHLANLVVGIAPGCVRLRGHRAARRVPAACGLDGRPVAIEPRPDLLRSEAREALTQRYDRGYQVRPRRVRAVKRCAASLLEPELVAGITSPLPIVHRLSADAIARGQLRDREGTTLQSP